MGLNMFTRLTFSTYITFICIRYGMAKINALQTTAAEYINNDNKIPEQTMNGLGFHSNIKKDIDDDFHGGLNVDSWKLEAQYPEGTTDEIRNDFTDVTNLEYTTVPIHRRTYRSSCYPTPTKKCKTIKKPFGFCKPIRICVYRKKYLCYALD